MADRAEAVAIGREEVELCHPTTSALGGKIFASMSACPTATELQPPAHQLCFCHRMPQAHRIVSQEPENRFRAGYGRMRWSHGLTGRPGRMAVRGDPPYRCPSHAS